MPDSATEVRPVLAGDEGINVPVRFASASWRRDAYGLAREADSCLVPDPLVSLISRNRNFLQGYDFAESGLGDPVHLAGAGRALASEGPGLGHYGRYFEVAHLGRLSGAADSPPQLAHSSACPAPRSWLFRPWR